MKRALLCGFVVFLTAGLVVAGDAKPERGWLGVQMASKTMLKTALAAKILPERYHSMPNPELVLENWEGTGVLIVAVLPKTPAERAGLFPGDIVQDLNGIRVDRPQTLAYLMGRAIPGRDGTIGVLRDGTARELLFIVGAREESKSKPQPKTEAESIRPEPAQTQIPPEK